MACMFVTDIEPYMRGKGRVAISLNDKFAFVLYKGELSQYGLEVGCEVDDDLYMRIMRETVFPRARKRGMNLLKTMDRTESDVRRRLSESGYPPEAVDDAVEYLRSYRYIDDARYAEEYIRCKIASMSPKMIRMKLSEKGISREITEEAFAAFSDDELTGDGGVDAERELIAKLIRKRCPNGTGDLDYNARQKLYAYLYGKGFEIRKIDEVLNGSDT